MKAKPFVVLFVMAALCGMAPFVAGSASALTATPNPLNVGNAIILPPNAASKHGIVTLTNNLGASVTILSITSDHPQFVPDQSCVKLLTPHKICGFTVTFTPSAPGALSAILTITNSGPTHHVTLEGFGKHGKLNINPDPVGFGKLYVQTPIVRTVTLLNNNPVQMTVSALGFSDSHFSETDNCAGTIAAHGSCHVWVNLKAASPGLLAGVTMNVTDNAAGSPQHVPLGGNVLALPACAAGTSGTFTPNPIHMFTWRIYHTATTLKTGKVLIVGGTGKALVTHAELYNFKKCKFVLPGSDTPNSRQYHSATLLANGKVLIAGGEVDTASTSAAAATAEIFNPGAHNGAGGFSPTGSMNFAREFHTATLLANGKVLIAGGSTNGYTGMAQAEIYDPVTGKFTLTGAMALARLGHTATLLSDGKVLIAGGTPNGGTIYSNAEVFDPAANHGVGQFSLLGNSINAARYDAVAAMIILGADAGEVLIAGGYNTSIGALDTADLFEPGNNPLSGVFGTPANSMSAGRESPTVTRLLDGNLLVAGGTCNSAASGGQPSADLLMVTGPDLEFNPVGSMLDGLVNHAAAILPDGQVLVTGGWQFNPLSCANPCVSSGCSSSPTNHAELYHP